jgi:hypothetical protein
MQPALICPALLKQCFLSIVCCPCVQARWFSRPDVWAQLLRHLLRDAACRQALLNRSSGAAAAPAELMLMQLAASLAEEVAATTAGQQYRTAGWGYPAVAQ